MSNIACAEDRLFPTDILDEGEIDAQISIDYDTHSSKVLSNGDPGRATRTISSESIEVRYGLGSNWHVGINLPYLSKDTTHIDYDRPVVHYTNTGREGAQNPQFWAKYGFIHDRESPWSLSGELLISPDIRSNTATIYEGHLSAGWKADDALRYYGEFTSTYNDKSNDIVTSHIGLGAYKGINEYLTLVPHGGYTRFSSTKSFSSQYQYDAGIAAHIQCSNNTYLIPDLVFYANSSGDSKTVSYHRDFSGIGKSIRISLYHIF